MILDEFTRRGVGEPASPAGGGSTLERLRAEIMALTQQSGVTSDLAGTMLDFVKHPSYEGPRPPERSRAAFLQEVLWPLRRTLHETHLAGRLELADSAEALELAKRLSQLDRELHVAGADDRRAKELETTQLRPLSQRVRAFAMRKHLLVAQPLWGNPRIAAFANAVYFAGRAEIRQKLLAACADLSLQLTEPPAATAAPDANFAQLLAANACVFDMAAAQGPDRAAVAYSLGIAWTLGKPVVVHQDAGMKLPFDVNLPSVTETELSNAVSRACCQANTSAHSTESAETLVGSLEARYGSLEDATSKQSLELLREQVERPDWTTVVRSARQLIRMVDDDGSLLLVHPRYPIRYRSASRPRLFHVMPFGSRYDESMNAARSACTGVAEYVRGDQVMDVKIVESIWDEICRATHVLVDLTDFNANVALELGIAHCMGKQTLVVGESGTERQLFAEIGELRIHPYRAGDMQGLASNVRGFVSK
jgi:hypothetical protein